MKDFFYKLNERLSAIGGKKNLTESAAGAYPGDVPEHLDETNVSVDTQHYDWGDLKIIRVGPKGIDYSIILHPEHIKYISELHDGDGVGIKTESGDRWYVTRDGDIYMFEQGNGSGYVEVDADELGIDPGSAQLDELSKGTLGSYIKKASQDSQDAAYAASSDHGRGYDSRGDRHYDHAEKRQRGIGQAVDKLTREDEQLDELSSKTLGSYVDKANRSRDNAHEIGNFIRQNPGRDANADHKDLEHFDNRKIKRTRGIEKATDKLTKECGMNEHGSGVESMKGTWQSHMHEEADIEGLISGLRKAYANINTIDPSSPTYKKLIDFLDGLDQEHLQTLADAGVKFVSMLAKNRLKRSVNEINNEYSMTESSDDWGLESWEDVVSAGLSMLNDGMPIRDILNMFRDEGFISSDNEVRDLIAALKNKGGSAMESRRSVNEISKDTATKYIKKASAGATDFEDVPEKRKKGVHTALKKKHGGAKVPATEGYRVIPKLDDEYEERQGLEGPFNANGRPIYYDPREGKYWDPKTDFYLDDEEAAMLFNESYEVVVEHNGKLKKIIVDLPQSGKRK